MRTVSEHPCKPFIRDSQPSWKLLKVLPRKGFIDIEWAVTVLFRSITLSSELSVEPVREKAKRLNFMLEPEVSKRTFTLTRRPSADVGHIHSVDAVHPPGVVRGSFLICER